MSPRLIICDICSDIPPFFYFETNTTNLYGRPLMSCRYLWSFHWKFTHTLQDKANHCPQHKLVSNKPLQAVPESYAKELNRSAYYTKVALNQLTFLFFLSMKWREIKNETEKVKQGCPVYKVEMKEMQILLCFCCCGGGCGCLFLCFTFVI